MSNHPDWTPTQDERYGDWLGVLISDGFVFWDYRPQTNDSEYVSVLHEGGDTIDTDVNHATVWTASESEDVKLPVPADYGIGKSLSIYAASDFKLKVAAPNGEGSRGIINGLECTDNNEISIAEGTLLKAVPIDDLEWKLTEVNLNTAITTITYYDSPYLMTNTNQTLLCDCVSGAILVSLPTVTSYLQHEINIKKVDSSANAVTIDAYSTETIDGATTKTLSSQYDNLTIQNNENGWWII